MGLGEACTCVERLSDIRLTPVGESDEAETTKHIFSAIMWLQVMGARPAPRDCGARPAAGTSAVDRTRASIRPKQAN